MSNITNPWIGTKTLMHVITHTIYENDNPLPVLRHQFFGETLDKAKRIYKVHCKNDAFLRACDVNGRFGNIRCKAVIRVTIEEI